MSAALIYCHVEHATCSEYSKFQLILTHEGCDPLSF